MPREAVPAAVTPSLRCRWNLGGVACHPLTQRGIDRSTWNNVLFRPGLCGARVVCCKILAQEQLKLLLALVDFFVPLDDVASHNPETPILIAFDLPSFAN